MTIGYNRLLEKSDARVNRLSARIEELEAQLASKDTAIKEAVRQRDEWAGLCKQAEAQLAEANARLSETRDECAQAIFDRDQAADDVKSLEKEVATLKVQLSEEYRDWMKEQCNEECRYGERLYLEAVTRAKKAEARAADLEKAKKVADAALHYYEVDDGNVEWDALAFNALDNAVREYRAALNPDAREEGKSE